MAENLPKLASPLAPLLPPGSWQHGEPRMDAVPALGQHTRGVLGGLGYAAEQIDDWARQGTI